MSFNSHKVTCNASARCAWLGDVVRYVYIISEGIPWLIKASSHL